MRERKLPSRIRSDLGRGFCLSKFRKSVRFLTWGDVLSQKRAGGAHKRASISHNVRGLREYRFLDLGKSCWISLFYPSSFLRDLLIML